MGRCRQVKQGRLRAVDTADVAADAAAAADTGVVDAVVDAVGAGVGPLGQR